MSPEKKKHLLDIFQQASLYLGLFALVPYSFGDLANALPPEVKKYTALISLALAGATRLTAAAISFLSAPDAPTQQQPKP